MNNKKPAAVVQKNQAKTAQKEPRVQKVWKA